MDCDECGLPSSPVWAHYEAVATIDGLEGRARVLLPMHVCGAGHVSGWRPGNDHFIDLPSARDPIDFGALAHGTVDVRRTLIGGSRCGQCGEKLRLEPTGRRLEGRVRMPIDGQQATADFDVDLPEVVCQSCTARPSPDSKSISDTAADVTGWLYRLLAMAMPPDRLVKAEPRTTA